MDNPSEKFTLDFEQASGYLKVVVRADAWTPAMADEYNRQLAEKIATLNPERILLVREIPFTLRLVATFSLMSDFVEGLGRRKVAVVNPFPLLKEDLEFVVKIATNRGEEYKLFANATEAEEWLLG